MYKKNFDFLLLMFLCWSATSEIEVEEMYSSLFTSIEKKLKRLSVVPQAHTVWSPNTGAVVEVLHTNTRYTVVVDHTYC